MTDIVYASFCLIETCLRSHFFLPRVCVKKQQQQPLNPKQVQPCYRGGSNEVEIYRDVTASVCVSMFSSSFRTVWALVEWVGERELAFL